MNDLISSDTLVDHVKLSESLVLVPRPDPVGIITYGWGHRTYAGEVIPAAIDETQAELLLQSDLMKAAQGVRLCVEVELNQDRFDALTDFAFNLGAAALHSSTMLKCINREEWADAAVECNRWVHDHAGHVLGGLVTRRQWEANLLNPAVTVANTVVNVPSILPPPDFPTLTERPDGSFVIPLDPAQAAINQELIDQFRSEGIMTFVPSDSDVPPTAA